MFSKSLLPFYISILCYWVCYIPVSQPGLQALVLKVAPTLALYYAVSTSITSTSSSSAYYAQKIAVGLLFSAVGDAALVWSSLFLLGILAFAVAHAAYIQALSSKGALLGKDAKKSLQLGAALYGATLCVWFFFMRPGLAQKGLELVIGVPLYIVWLTTTVWRAGTVGDWRIFLGSAIFMISDLCIGLNEFVLPLEYAQVMIMSTYQLAQYLISLSALQHIYSNQS